MTWSAFLAMALAGRANGRPGDLPPDLTARRIEIAPAPPPTVREPSMTARAKQGRSLVITGVAFSMVAMLGILGGGVALATNQRCMGCSGDTMSYGELGVGIGEAIVGAGLVVLGSAIWGRSPPLSPADVELVQRAAERRAYETRSEPRASPRARLGRSLNVTGAIVTILGLIGAVPGAYLVASLPRCSTPCFDEGSTLYSWLFLGIGLGELVVGATLVAVGAALTATAPPARISLTPRFVVDAHRTEAGLSLSTRW